MAQEEEKTLKKERMASTLSVRTLDAYDPYEYRTGMGHLSNLQAWIHLVKCSFGTGVLSMPVGFKHAGLIPGFILGIVIGFFCLYCIHILIRSSVHIAAREKKPYLPINETMKYTFEHGYPIFQGLGKCMNVFTSVIIAAYHFGICVAYMNYMAQSSLKIIGLGNYTEKLNGYTVLSTLCVMPFVCLINCIRNLQYLAPVALVGNILVVLSMGVISYYILVPDENGFLNGDYELVGTYATVPLFIGIILFAIEAYGVVLAVERDMKKPEDFVGYFGIFNRAMVPVLAWYLIIGSTGYMKYGQSVKSTISLTIPSDHWTSVAMYVMVSLSLFCSYPLHCFVCIDIVWNNNILPKVKSRRLMWEILFRCGAVVASGFFALIIPKLDIILSLIGAVCLSFLGIMMPGVMEYNVAWSKYGNQWSLTMVKDICIAAFGFVAFVIGTYGCAYDIVTSSPLNSTVSE